MMLLNASLLHVPQNRIRSAYNRAQYWDEWVRLMEWYEGAGRRMDGLSIEAFPFSHAIVFIFLISY